MRAGVFLSARGRSRFYGPAGLTLSSVWRSSKKHSFAPASRSMVWARARVDVNANTVAAPRDHSEARMIQNSSLSDQQMSCSCRWLRVRETEL